MPMSTTTGLAFDVFLSHNSADKPAVEELATRLKAAGLEPWLDKWNLVPGDAWQPALEEALRDSATCAVFVGPSGFGAWQHEEMRAAINRRVTSRQKEERFRVIPVLLPGAVRGDRSQLPDFLTATTWVEFRRSLDDETAFRILERAIRGLPPGPDQSVSITDCPYRGLEFFDVAHAPLFFGRAAVTDWLLSALRGTLSAQGPTRFLAIIGASGSGKSSLARAGLLAALQNGGIEGSADWLTTICRPGPGPLESLADALAKTEGINLGQGLAANLLEQLKDALRARHNTLHQTARASLGDAQPARRLVVLVDQFEELFTVCRDDAERQAFIGNLLYAARVTQGQTIILLTMRADFYGKCASYSELSATISEHQFLVGPLTTDELREAIERPAQMAGCEFEPGLVELLVEEVQRQPGALPLLQYGLLRMWTTRTGRRITTADYRAIGQLEGIIEKRAEEVFKTFTPPQQEACRQLFLRLTEPGEGAEDTKRRVPWHELTGSQSDASGMADIVKSLADERLLTTSGSTAAADAVVEVAHETLIRRWQRLRDWIDADRAGLRTHRRLTEAATEWVASQTDTSQRDVGLLYQDTRLAVAKDWADKHPQELNQFECEFLEASTHVQEDERERERRSARRQRTLARIAFAVAAVAIISFVIAGWQWKQVQNSFASQTAVLVEAVVAAPDDQLPTLVEKVEPYRVGAEPRLREIAADPERPHVQRANAALALAGFGESLTTAKPVLALAEDPSGRTKFIHDYKRFHFDLLEAVRALEASKFDPEAADFRSGLCAALGLIAWDKIPADGQAALGTTLVELYTGALDGGTHSAAYFALKRWKQAIPPIPRSKMRPDDDRGWLVNSLGMTMIRIPHGTFTMGDNSSQARAGEKPSHKVTLTQDFYLCDRQVTVEQFKDFAAKANDVEKEIAKSWDGEDRSVSPEKDCPVQRVSWIQAVAFCNWASHCEGRTPCYRLSKVDTVWKCELVADASGYRLPSEAQWEYACRAVSRLQFAFGDEERLLSEYGYSGGNSTQRTWPGGEKLPNGWGLFDMHGNVGEWCQDWHADDYYANSPANDPPGAAEDAIRVHWGGGCWDDAVYCRSAHRNWYEPSGRFDSLGFRLARSVFLPEAAR
ncbi:MAG: SUMF1/EgtB/PvdO family nonheme iron enzyme [Planctomycetota bacterium]|nr:SUMF1/EgtB/PvdO family nonheme iron enzyme [Planctomycetota bacterium]